MKQIMGIFRRKEMKRERKSAIIELLRLVANDCQYIFDLLGFTDIGIWNLTRRFLFPVCKLIYDELWYLLDVTGSIDLGQDDR